MKSQLRRGLAAHLQRLGPAWLGRQQPGEIATVTTRGLDGLDPYFARYLPQLVLACLVPAAVLATVATADWISAVIIAVTLPLIPIFAALVGMHTRARTQRQWRLLARLGGHFLDVVEGQWTTCQPCSFSLFQIGGGNNDQTPTQIIAIPHLLSLLSTNHWNGKVVGLDPLQAQYSKSYGPGYYVPNVFIQYWSMRLMAYLGALVLLISVWGLWLVRRGKLATSRVFLWVAVWSTVLPFVMNTAGWLLTESGRQPWIVQGIMLTKNGISPTVSTTWLWISLIAFVPLYGTLGTVDLLLMLKYSGEQLPPARTEADVDAPVPAVTY